MSTSFFSKDITKYGLQKHSLFRGCLAEFCGTVILVIFGCGVLAQVKLAKLFPGEHGSFLSICLIWGLAVMLGVFFAGGIGHGHINPAITFAFAVIGKLRWIAVPCYSLSQLLGGIVGALCVYAVNMENIKAYAEVHDAGQFLTNSTGNIFVTTPNIATWACLLDQIMGTALLAAGALAITDERTWKLPGYLHPLYLGLLVLALVGALGINAGCALNPARDLGPRITIAMLGWKDAFSQGGYYFWVPIVGPYLGALIGSIMYELSLGMHTDNGDKSGELIS